MTEPQSKAADWVENLIRDYQDKLTCGLFETIYSLDGPALDTVMEGQARTCVGAFLDLTALPIPMEIDGFLEHMRLNGPSKVDIRREGDVIHWNELHHGECPCPYVRRGAIRLDAKLCICGAYWVQQLFEKVTGAPVEVEAVSTVATGAQNCDFRITLKPRPGTDGRKP